MDELGAHGAERVDIDVLLLERGQLLMESPELFEECVCGYSLAREFLVERETLLRRSAPAAVSCLRDHEVVGASVV